MTTMSAIRHVLLAVMIALCVAGCASFRTFARVERFAVPEEPKVLHIEAFVLNTETEEDLSDFVGRYDGPVECNVVATIDDTDAVTRHTDPAFTDRHQAVRWLMHCQVWQYLSSHEHLRHVFVFEPSSKTSFVNHEAFSREPPDWHMCILDSSDDGIAQWNRIDKLTSCKAYVINQSGSDWLWEHGNVLPASLPFETAISRLIPRGFNVYSLGQ